MKKINSLILLLLISSLPALAQNLSNSKYYKVYFDSDKHDVRVSEHQELNSLVKKALHAGYYEIDIQAHTDYDGSITYNQKLSERRAESVVRFLVNKGLSKDHFTYNCHGEGKPASTNSTDQGKQLNRRVEIRLRTYTFNTPSDVLKAFRKNDGQEFKLSGGDQRVTARKGTSVHVPEGAFTDAKGNVVPNQDVTLKIQEFHDMSDAIFHQLSTQSGGQILESGGMFLLEARRGNEALNVSKDKALNVSLPSKNIQKNMQVFTGVENEEGNMDWTPVETPFELVRKDGKKAPAYKLDLGNLSMHKQRLKHVSPRAHKPLLYTIPIEPGEPKAPKVPKVPDYPDLNKVFSPFWTQVLPEGLAKLRAKNIHEENMTRYERKMERYEKSYERYLSKMDVYKASMEVYQERISEIIRHRHEDSLLMLQSQSAIFDNAEVSGWNGGIRYLEKKVKSNDLRMDPKYVLQNHIRSHMNIHNRTLRQIYHNLSFLGMLDSLSKDLMKELEEKHNYTIIPYEDGKLSYYKIASAKVTDRELGYSNYHPRKYSDAFLDSMLIQTGLGDVFRKASKEYALAKAKSGPITHTSLTSVYNASISTTGFINCDRFYNVPKEQMVRISIPDAKEEKINFIIPEMNSSLYAYSDGENGKYVNVPRGKVLKMVVIGVDDGAPTLETKTLTAQSDVSLTISPQKTTLEQFQAVLASL